MGVLTAMLLLPLLPPLLPSLPPLLPPPPMLPPPTVWAMPVLAMVASGRGRLRLSPRLMLMPAFCTEVLVTLPLATLVLAMLVWAMALTDMALLLPPSPPLPPSLPRCCHHHLCCCPRHRLQHPWIPRLRSVVISQRLSMTIPPVKANLQDMMHSEDLKFSL